MSKRRKLYPLPEVLADRYKGEWTIEDKPYGHTIPMKQLMEVPLDGPCRECGKEHALEVRTHEMAHAKWSPKRWSKGAQEKAQPWALEAAEEMRINQKLTKLGYPPDQGSECPEVVDFKASLAAKSTDPKMLLGTLAAAYQTSDYARVTSQFTASENKAAHAAVHAINATNNIWRRFRRKFQTDGTIQVAEFLSKMAEVMEEDPEDGEDDPTIQDLVEDIEFEIKSMSGHGRWGKMEIDEPRRPHPFQGVAGAKKWHTSQTGDMPRYIQRWPLDQRIWGKKKVEVGGTVLIDCSGSMHLTERDIDKIMKVMPAATVAGYSGDDSCQGGILRIFAKDRRKVLPRYIGPPAGYANVIDGPALRWLSKQPKPRIWVSDGWVTGVGEDQTPNLVADTANIMRKGQIDRYDPDNYKDFEEMARAAIRRTDKRRKEAMSRV